MRNQVLAGLLLATISGLAIASSGGDTERPDTSKFEWPVANDLAAYGIRLRMSYREARQRMIKHGWAPDPTEANARCCVPCDHVPVRSWALFKAKDLMRDLLVNLKSEPKLACFAA